MTYAIDKFSLHTAGPIPGTNAGIYESFSPAEMIAAAAAGTGPGVPDASGTLTPGTILPGHFVMMDSSGNMVLATSPDLNAANSVMMWMVVTGDNDYSGMASGKINCVHGGVRADTERFDPAQTYTPGIPLIAVAGVLTPKVFGDNRQIVAYVGPTHVSNAKLDIYTVQGGSRY